MTKRSLFIILIFSFVALNLAISLANIDTNKCKKRNGHFPMEGSGCKSYYICRNWQPKSMQCPRNLHFHPAKALCIRPEEYPCFEIPKSKECPRDNGKFLKPGSECKQYYDCCGGEYTLRKCYGDLLFDPESEKCQYPESYTCVETSTTKILKSTISTTAAQESFEESSNDSSENGRFSTSTKRKSTATSVNTSLLPVSSTDADSLEESKESFETTDGLTEGYTSSEIGISSSDHDNKPSTESLRTTTLISKESSFTTENEYYSSKLTDDGISTTSAEISSLSSITDVSKFTTKETYVTTAEPFMYSTTENLASSPSSTFNSGGDDISTSSLTTDILGTKISTTENEDIIETSTTDNLLQSQSSVSDDYNDDLSTSNIFSSTSETKPFTTSTEDISDNNITRLSTTENLLSRQTSDGERDSSTSNIETNIFTAATQEVTEKEVETSSSTENLFSSWTSVSDGDDDSSISDVTKISETEVFTTASQEMTGEATKTSFITENLESSQSSVSIGDDDSSTPTTMTKTSETIVNNEVTGENTMRFSTTNGFSPSSVTLVFTTTMEEVSESVTLNIFCPEPNGYFPHPNDRHKFIGCVGGDPKIMDCPSNLVYNHKKRSCVYDKKKIFPLLLLE